MAAHAAPLVNIAGLKWHRGTMKKLLRAKGGTRMDSSGGGETVSDPLWGIACSLLHNDPTTENPLQRTLELVY